MKNSTNKLINVFKLIIKTLKILLLIAVPVILITQVYSLATHNDSFSSIPLLYCSNSPITMEGSNGETFVIKKIIGESKIEGTGLSAGVKIYNLIIILIAMALFFQMLRIALSFISSIEKGEIFTSVNIKQLQNIGYLLLANFLIGFLLMLTNSIVTGSLSGVKVSYILGYLTGQSFDAFLTIAFVFLMAGVFRVGYNLKEENQSFV